MNQKDLILKRIKYMIDPKAFINDHMHLLKPDNYTGLYDYQRDLIDAYEENKYNIVRKSRYMHVDSTTALYVAWCLIFKNSYQIILTTTTRYLAEEFLNDVFQIIENYGDIDYNNKSIEYRSKTFIKLRNKSVVKVGTSPMDFVGWSGDLIIAQNAAFMSEPIATQIYLTAGIDSKMIIYSTVNGYDGFFYVNWNNVRYQRTTLHWSQHPIYSEGITKNEDGKLTSPWYEEMSRMMNHNSNMVAQELDCEFV